jgi:hypothetical protein
VRPYLEKNISQERAGEVDQGLGLKFKPQYHKKTETYTSMKRQGKSVAQKL